MVTGLGAGQRTPVFRLGTSWNRFTWYLRLPGATGAPWSGVVRAECASEYPSAAIARADLSVVTLPRFASHSYKDPRAPQNLIAIGGLERRLRSLRRATPPCCTAPWSARRSPSRPDRAWLIRTGVGSYHPMWPGTPCADPGPPRG